MNQSLWWLVRGNSIVQTKGEGDDQREATIYITSVHNILQQDICRISLRYQKPKELESMASSLL